MKLKSNLSEKMPQRALKWSLLTSLLFGTLLAMTGQVRLSLGFGIGAVLSLFSLWSLSVGIPVLICQGAGTLQRVAFGLLLWTKLPVFILLLYVASQLGETALMGAIAGIALCPMMIAFLTMLELVLPLLLSRRTRFVTLETPVKTPATAVTTQAIPKRG